MFDLVGNRTNSAARSLLLMASAAMLFPITACNKQDPPPVQAGPKTFASPQDAGRALAMPRSPKSGSNSRHLWFRFSGYYLLWKCRGRQSFSERIRQRLPGHKPVAEINRQQRVVAGWR